MKIGIILAFLQSCFINIDIYFRRMPKGILQPGSITQMYIFLSRKNSVSFYYRNDSNYSNKMFLNIFWYLVKARMTSVLLNFPRYTLPRSYLCSPPCSSRGRNSSSSSPFSCWIRASWSSTWNVIQGWSWNAPSKYDSWRCFLLGSRKTFVIEFNV